MTDILGIGEALAPDRAARLYGGGGMFPHGGGLAVPFDGIPQEERVAGIPEESGAPLRLRVRDEDARPDRLMETLRANIAPRRGESFEQYNDRLNAARADVASMVSEARRRGVRVSGSYHNNCISTVCANYNDRGHYGTEGKYYDPNGLYQSFGAVSNWELANDPARFGFRKVFSYRPDKKAAGVTPKDGWKSEDDKLRKYKRERLAEYDLRRGDVGNVLDPVGEKRKTYYPYHAITIKSRGKDGSVLSDYAPGLERESRYQKNNDHWLQQSHLALGHDFYRYVGTPGERENRRRYYDEYKRRESEYDDTDASFRRHHANVERQLKSPEFWGMQIELPEYIWQK